MAASVECITSKNELNRKPQKKYYRQRAHTNPLADHSFDYPVKPSDWKKCCNSMYNLPENQTSKKVTFADIGCGYGGLLVSLSKMFPDNLALGMEIRVKVSDYVIDRIKALRSENPGQYENIAYIRSNAMKLLPCFFEKGQLEKMFFLFPDPHFKKSKHKWRIINETLLAEYAYVLKVGVGRVYIATDVHDLYEWMDSRLSNHPLFEKLSDQETENDPTVSLLFESTEEGHKVSRAGGNKWKAVYQRVMDPYKG